MSLNNIVTKSFGDLDPEGCFFYNDSQPSSSEIREYTLQVFPSKNRCFCVNTCLRLFFFQLTGTIPCYCEKI